MRAGALVMAMGVLLGAPRAAEACSCGGWPEVVPEDGAVDVPLNARLFFQDNNEAERIELRRVGEPGPIALTVEERVESTYEVAVLARPVDLLAPDTTYELVIPWPDSPGQVVSTFTTGSARDDLAPTFGGVTGVELRRWRGDGRWVSSCWTREDGTDVVHVSHAPYPDDLAVLALEVRREGDPSPPWRALRKRSWIGGHPETVASWFSSDLCSATNAPELEAGATYCARLTVFDLAGNSAGAGPEVCAPSVTCRLSDTLDFVTPSTPCDPTPYLPPDAGGAAGPDGGGAGEANGGGAGVRSPTELPVKSRRRRHFERARRSISSFAPSLTKT